MMEEPVLNISKVEFDVYGNDEVARYSAVNVVHPETYENNTPKVGGLLDPRLGVTDLFQSCATCKENVTECVGHYGHLRLSEPVFHWGFMTYVKNILSCICIKSCKLLIPPSEVNKRVMGKHRRNRFNEIRALCAMVKVSPYSGMPVPKFNVEVKRFSGLIYLTAEYTVTGNNEALLTELTSHGDTTVDMVSDNKRKIKQVLTAKDCLYILRNVSPLDCEVLGIKNPADLILENFPVPPVAIRPSIKGDFLSQGYSEDGTTHKLADIVKFNNKLTKEKERSLVVTDNYRYLETYQQCLQYHCATYFDNESMSLPKCELKSGSGTAAKSITSRFKGKHGRIRANLHGKRVDYSARTVITSDPDSNINELGVPLKVAKTVTFPEIVTPYNIEELTTLVRNGRDSYPGANFVENPHVKGFQRKNVVIDLRYRNRSVVLRYGWIVHRHLRNGDVVLFNRQPSLHKMSMMAHTVRVINNPHLMTFRMNVTATEPYNADFDGDEMNLFAPQSEQARQELLRLADIRNHIVSPKNSKPIINLKQDSCIGCYKFTRENTPVEWDVAMMLLAQTSALPRLMNGNLKLEKRKYTPREIISMLIPGRISADTTCATVQNGELLDGFLGKSEIGGEKNSIPHLIMDTYSKDRATRFMDDLQRINNVWLMRYNGFTVGLGDSFVDIEVQKAIKDQVKAKLLEACNLITETEDHQLLDRPHFEEYMYREMSSGLGDMIKKLKQAVPATNNIFVMVDSGAKGKWQNIGHIMGCLGQSPFESRLMPKKLNGRTLPYFPKQDDHPKARGFITRSFNEGIDPCDFFYGMTDGRSGLIDTAIRTADTGYMQRKTARVTEDVVVLYDMTVRAATGGLVQLTYGDNGYDAAKQMEVTSRLIRMDNKAVKEEFGFSASEAKSHGVTEKQNLAIVESFLKDRDTLRQFQQRASMNSKVVEDIFNLPFHIVRLIKYHAKKQGGKNGGTKLTVSEVLEGVEKLLSPGVTCLGAISQEQQENVSSLRYINDIRHKSIFRILLREFLAPRNILVTLKMGKAQFLSMIEEIRVSFNRNVVQPCEMVGMLAAQSIGETLTQFTLNTFHQSGMAEMGNLNAISRFKELFSFTKNVKNPIVRIYLTQEIRHNEKLAHRFRNTVNNTSLDDLTSSCRVVLDYDGLFRPSHVPELFMVSGSRLTNLESLGGSSPWVVEFKLDRAIMMERDIDLLMVKIRLISFWEDVLLTKGLKKRDKDVVGQVNAMYAFSSQEDADEPILYIRLDLEDYNVSTLSTLMVILLEKFTIKGVPGVIKTVCKEEMLQTFDESTGAIVEKKEFVITAEVRSGTTVRSIFTLEGIDVARTQTSDVHTVYQMMGIEAARAGLMNEIQTLFRSEGHSINHQHFSIVIDVMTFHGMVTPVNSSGLSRTDSDPLSRVAFEKTMDHIVKAAIFNESDRMESVSSRVMSGRVIKGGTGMVTLLADIEKIEQTKQVENKYLLEIKNVDISRLYPDSYILRLWNQYMA